jgi:cellulose synthase/poly-beta-1,6-N-acetylglucosamine synthase-like glycosyltransferase
LFFGWIRMNRNDRTAVSVVIAAHNEAQNLPQLLSEVSAALQGRFTFEIIVVDDGSTDETPRVLDELIQQQSVLRMIRHTRSCDYWGDRREGRADCDAGRRWAERSGRLTADAGGAVAAAVWATDSDDCRPQNSPSGFVVAAVFISSGERGAKPHIE